MFVSHNLNTFAHNTNINSIMRKLLITSFFSLLAIIRFTTVWADSDNGGSSPLTGAATSHSIQYSEIERIPANVDILVVVDDNTIAIRFNGDFGDGRYCITNAAGNTTVGTMTASKGGFEVICYTSSAVGTNSMSFQFVGGASCTIEW